MTDSVTIPVNVDTRKAAADLAQLHHDKEKSKRRVTAAAQRTSALAVRAFAFVGAGSATMSFHSAAPSGNVNIFEEAWVPLAAAAQQVADQALGKSAKAHRTAREETKAAFAYHVGRTAETAGMRDFYNTVAKIQADVESGRNLIRRDPRFVGPDFTTVAGVSVAGQVKLFLENLQAANPFCTLMNGFDYVVEGIKAD